MPFCTLVVVVTLLSCLWTECSHLHRAGHIDAFALVSEEAISKGIRRIVALTGHDAIEVLPPTHMHNHLPD